MTDVFDNRVVKKKSIEFTLCNQFVSKEMVFDLFPLLLKFKFVP